MKYYTLDSAGSPIHEPDLKKWEAWFHHAVEAGQIHIAADEVGASIVSTVFLGHTLDENSSTVWETAVLGGHSDQVKDRCGGTREQAEAMHARMVARVRSQQPEP